MAPQSIQTPGKTQAPAATWRVTPKRRDDFGLFRDGSCKKLGRPMSKLVTRRRRLGRTPDIRMRPSNSTTVPQSSRSKSWEECPSGALKVAAALSKKQRSRQPGADRERRVRTRELRKQGSRLAFSFSGRSLGHSGHRRSVLREGRRPPSVSEARLGSTPRDRSPARRRRPRGGP